MLLKAILRFTSQYMYSNLYRIIHKGCFKTLITTSVNVDREAEEWSLSSIGSRQTLIVYPMWSRMGKCLLREISFLQRPEPGNLYATCVTPSPNDTCYLASHKSKQVASVPLL